MTWPLATTPTSPRHSPCSRPDPASTAPSSGNAWLNTRHGLCRLRSRVRASGGSPAARRLGGTPPPPRSSDADTAAAGATGRPDPPARPPHTAPATHALSCGHPEPGSQIRHRLAVGDHRTHGRIPLLCYRQLPHEPGVSPISRSSCNPSAETLTPDQSDSRPPGPVNLAEQRIRRKQVLEGLTHEHYIAALPASGATENAGHGSNRISEPHRIERREILGGLISE